MPTVHEEGPYSFVFFSSDRHEPAHIHVKRDRQVAKFWLQPVLFAKNRGFPEHELNRIARLVIKNDHKLYAHMGGALKLHIRPSEEEGNFSRSPI